MLTDTALMQLVDYKSHRFMDLADVIRRIINQWNALEVWLKERIGRPHTGASPCAFPLLNGNQDLVQLMLDSITLISKRSQAEACNHVEILLTMYRLRVGVRDPRKPLKDWCAPSESVGFFAEVMPLVQKTRVLLQEAFDKICFSRYTQRVDMEKHSFISDMQVMLYPNSK